MPLTFHILAGVTVFHLTQNTIWGFIFAFLSHYFLDALLHQDYSIRNIENRLWKKSLPDFSKAFLDIVFGFSMVFLINGCNIPILIAGWLAILPDGFTLLYRIFPNNKLLAGHHKIHSLINTIGENKKIPVLTRIVSQFVVGAIAICLLI